MSVTSFKGKDFLDVGGGYATTPRLQEMLIKYEQVINRDLGFNAYTVVSVRAIRSCFYKSGDCGIES